MYKVYAIYTNDQDGNQILLCEGRDIETLASKFHSVPEYKQYNIDKLKIGKFVKEGEYEGDDPLPEAKPLNPEQEEFYRKLKETIDEA